MRWNSWVERFAVVCTHGLCKTGLDNAIDFGG